MNSKCKFTISMLILLGYLLTACSHKAKFIAPEIEPPTDLVPGYVPKGFELVSGFQLPGETALPATSTGEDVSHLARKPGFDLKSPSGHDIQGVYYQGKEHLILITKSLFPDGTLDLWQAAYEASWPKPCACSDLPRLDAIPFTARLIEIQEERTIGETRVAVLNRSQGWITVFVRGEYLITVESGISLDENLKVVASLLSV